MYLTKLNVLQPKERVLMEMTLCSDPEGFDVELKSTFWAPEGVTLADVNPDTEFGKAGRLAKWQAVVVNPKSEEPPKSLPLEVRTLKCVPFEDYRGNNPTYDRVVVALRSETDAEVASRYRIQLWVEGADNSPKKKATTTPVGIDGK